MKKQRTRINSFDYSNLESRRLLAGVSIEMVNGRSHLLIDGSREGDQVEVRQVNEAFVKVDFNGQSSVHATSSFERIEFLGRNGNDTFQNFTSIASKIVGHAGNDVLIGGNGNNWIQGGSGNDQIVGGDRNDIINAGAGDDSVFGGKRHDRIMGGAGNDKLSGQDGNDYINGEDGNDLLSGQNGIDQLFGGGGADEIFGGADNDTATGGAGNDVINLGAGFDKAEYENSSSAYSVTGNESSLTVQDRFRQDGTDFTIAVEQLVFADVFVPAAPTYQPSAAESRSFDLLNSARESKALTSLTLATDLANFAKSWSTEMSQNGFGHSTSSQRSHLLQGDRDTTIENIAFASDTTLSESEVAELFHQTWLNSSTHYSNMMNDKNTEVGVGIVKGSDGWYGTHVFSNG